MTARMTDDRWLRVKQLFEAAVEQPLSERSAFLSAAVAGDETLRREVEALLAADAAGAPLSDCGRLRPNPCWPSCETRPARMRSTAPRLLG